MSANSKDVEAVGRLVESWAAAVRQKDLAGILRDHAPSIVMFDVPPPLQMHGLAAYERSWEVFFAWSRDLVVYEITDMHITAGQGVAFVAALMRCAGTEADGAQVELEFRLTMGLQKFDGRWIVTHEHHSVPAATYAEGGSELSRHITDP